MHINDPCGNDPGQARVVAIFLKQLFLDCNCRSATMRGYADAVNLLYLRRNFPEPADFTNKDNMVFKIYHNLKKEEDIMRKRHPLDIEIFAALKITADNSHPDSDVAVTFDWYCIIRVSGYRSCEFAQHTQTRVEVHTYPSGRQVIMAFIGQDWLFKDRSGCIITNHGPHNLNKLGNFRTKHRIQKNRQNGQEITIMADDANPALCPCRAAYRIFLRSLRLEQPENLPLGLFVNKFGATKYLTQNKVNEVLRAAARTAHPDWPDADIMKISSHSGRIYALVLLAEAGKQAWFMKDRLRWLGDSFRHYLRDTAGMSANHLDAISGSAAQVVQLLGSNLGVLPNIVPEDTDMGEYNDHD